MEGLVFYEMFYENFVGEPIGDAGGEGVHNEMRKGGDEEMGMAVRVTRSGTIKFTGERR